MHQTEICKDISGVAQNVQMLHVSVGAVATETQCWAVLSRRCCHQQFRGVLGKHEVDREGLN